EGQRGGGELQEAPPVETVVPLGGVRRELAVQHRLESRIARQLLETAPEGAAALPLEPRAQRPVRRPGLVASVAHPLLTGGRSSTTSGRAAGGCGTRAPDAARGSPGRAPRRPC